MAGMASSSWSSLPASATPSPSRPADALSRYAHADAAEPELPLAAEPFEWHGMSPDRLRTVAALE